MSLFDSLGLGAVFGNSYPIQPQFNQQVMLCCAQAQQQYQPIYHCKHGTDCPICIEDLKKREEEVKKQVGLETKKKLDYENRCKKYIKNFRRGQING